MLSGEWRCATLYPLLALSGCRVTRHRNPGVPVIWHASGRSGCPLNRRAVVHVADDVQELLRRVLVRLHSWPDGGEAVDHFVRQLTFVQHQQRIVLTAVKTADIAVEADVVQAVELAVTGQYISDTGPGHLRSLGQPANSGGRQQFLVSSCSSETMSGYGLLSYVP